MPILPGSSARIALGTGGFGSSIPEDDARKLMDRYVELGGDHLDTAHIYAAWIPGGWGASERCIGRWLRDRGLAGKVLVASKGAHFHLDEVQAPRVTPECIAADLRDSLDRLGQPSIGLYYLHRDDLRMPVGELLDALERERRAGRIGAYAASNWTATRLAEARRVAHAQGWEGFVANQVQWSLAEVPADGGGGMRAMDAQLRAWQRAAAMPIAAYASQANGFFARDWEGVSDFGHLACYATPANLARWRRVAARAAVLGVSRNALALAWMLNQPQPVLPLVGCRNLQQVDDSMGALAIRLAPAELQELEHGGGIPAATT